MEAMASYCPLITRDIGVYKGWLEDGVNCFKATTVEGFASAVSNCLSGKGSQVVENAYKTVKSMSLSNVGPKLKEAYESLLETKIS